ncbi:hypothetical protein BXZ70DRAFT_946067 [Cristinia sonorae]|uniref:Uncharacterized protein n=1 Tax=Cristinia sonorae TaxID=1940300 RepID=A0A8K0UJR0_9AGAR|nr:hypothetical protein BXZ70DRAFT_946067 [Cristinia sonorae]
MIFRERLARSMLGAAGVALVAHLITAVVPGTLHVFNMLQSAVAILAVAALAFLVVSHHRREGHLLTQTQEEMILIGAFGLFWFAVLVGIRSFRQAGGQATMTSPGAGAVQAASPPVANAGSGAGVSRTTPGQVGGRRAPPYPCSTDSVYCYVEEWRWL